MILEQVPIHLYTKDLFFHSYFLPNSEKYDSFISHKQDFHRNLIHHASNLETNFLSGESASISNEVLKIRLKNQSFIILIKLALDRRACHFDSNGVDDTQI